MAVFLIDGQRIAVKSAAELVQIMHANSRTPAADDTAYMLDVADRTVLQDGGKLRTVSAEAFVNDLVRHGFIAALEPIAKEDFARVEERAVAHYMAKWQKRADDKCGGKLCPNDQPCSCRSWALGRGS